MKRYGTAGAHVARGVFDDAQQRCAGERVMWRYQWLHCAGGATRSKVVNGRVDRLQELSAVVGHCRVIIR